jgi:hypothetical protein
MSTILSTDYLLINRNNVDYHAEVSSLFGTNGSGPLATNLGNTPAAATVLVTSSTGTDTTLPAASQTAAGVMTAADKIKFDTLETGAEVNVATNLTTQRDATSYTVESSTGTDATLLAATTALAGVMTAADKLKFDGLEPGAEVNVATNLANTPASTTVLVTSSTGTDTTLPAATASEAGVMTATDKTNLDFLFAGGGFVGTDLSNVPAASTVLVASSTGGDTTLPAATTAAAGVMTAADKLKFDGLEPGAEVNVATNLANVPAATTLLVTSSTGADTTLPAATASLAGVMTAADKTKFDGLDTGANNYVLPEATTSTLGGVKVGDGLAVQGDGTLSVAVNSNLNFLGSIDVTQTNPSGSETVGDFYVNSAASGAPLVAWGTDIDNPVTGGEMISKGGDGNWYQIGRTGANAVRTVSVSAPITNLGTSLDPTIAISEALPSTNGAGGARGSLSAQDKEKIDSMAAGAQVNVATNLDNVPGATTVLVSSSTGLDTTLPAATVSAAGVMTAADKTKFDSLETGAEVNVATNLGNIPAATTVLVSSSTGQDTTLPAATASAAGVMTATDKSNLDVLNSAGAFVGTNLTVVQSGATSVTIESSTGADATIATASASVAGVMTAADKAKLDGISAGAGQFVGTDLSHSTTSTSILIASSTGNDTTLVTASASAAGIMTGADYTHLYSRLQQNIAGLPELP